MKTVKKKIWIIGVLLLCAAMFYTVPVAAAKKTGWKVIKGKTYYFNNDGTMHKGFLKLNGKKYYFGEDGAAKKGFFTVESSNGSVSYFAQKDYSLVRNKWLYVKKNQWYYFDNSGRGLSGWFQIDEKCYYCHPQKGKLTGWKGIKGDEYCFTAEGYTKTSQWLKKGSQYCYVDYRGKVVKTKNSTGGTCQAYKKVYMIGDSRFARASKMGIKMNNTEYIAASGQGYDWLMREGWPRLMEQIMNSTEEGKSAIVINLGVNDLLNYKKYIRFVNKDMLTFAHKYQCDVYYVSVNPVNEEKYIHHSQKLKRKNNRLINQFNRELVSQLSLEVKYIDTNTYLMRKFNSKELTIEDGVHYGFRISNAIFDQIMMNVKP